MPEVSVQPSDTIEADSENTVQENPPATVTATSPEAAVQSDVLNSAALERLISEAEERGYKRGRNEKISIAMEQWETSVDLAPDLLLTPRKSLWD